MTELRRAGAARFGRDPRRQRGPSGRRPSLDNLSAMVDTSDPAFFHIAAQLQRLTAEGVDLNEESVAQAVADGRAQRDEEARRAGIPDSIVYYIRRSDLIKIGTTSKPRMRFHALLPDEILAWEPGGRPEEAARHKRFAHLRLHKQTEYFRTAPDLLSHIEAVRAEHGGPHPEWPTLQNVATLGSRAVQPTAPTSTETVTMREGADRLGIRYNTVCVWVHRGKLTPFFTDDEGIKFYLFSDMASLAERSARGAS